MYTLTRLVPMEMVNVDEGHLDHVNTNGSISLASGTPPALEVYFM